ncbi:MAG TPA: aminopeptidase [Dehalococcoidia bacterium]|nr:aminopeptidase [Dehalococcoidia bacterium]
MADRRIEKLADVLVNYSVAVRNGDKVIINGSTLCEPLLREVYLKVIQAGGYPFMSVSIPGTEELLYRYGNDDQLRHIPPPGRLIMETYDVRISILGDSNTRMLSTIDPARIVLHNQAHTEMTKIFMKRSASGELRWTLTLFPTNAYAQDAEMSLREYEDFVYGACLPDMNDPVGYWKKFSGRQQRIIEWLKGKKQVHLVGPDTELRLSIDGRIFVNCDGRFNMPDGEIFTGPVEDSVEGHVRFSYPTIYEGREVVGTQLWFEKGKVVRATAEKNEDFLLHTLDTDEGARRVGEFAIGTNEGITLFTREILFDEKINSSFHMALGAGYPETGSLNESAVHWDMVCDLRQNSEIVVDGQALYRNGKLAIDL